MIAPWLALERLAASCGPACPALVRVPITMSSASDWFPGGRARAYASLDALARVLRPRRFAQQAARGACCLLPRVHRDSLRLCPERRFRTLTLVVGAGRSGTPSPIQGIGDASTGSLRLLGCCLEADSPCSCPLVCSGIHHVDDSPQPTSAWWSHIGSDMLPVPSPLFLTAKRRCLW